MACGTPVITYRTGGSVEVITEDNGFVVEQGNYSQAMELLDNIKALNRR